MNAPKVEVTFRKQRRANGWFLVEQWPGKPDLEYGPMPESHVEPMMDEIVAMHEAAAASQDMPAISQDEAQRGFNPQEESQWLKQKRNPPAKK